ncbi:MAG: Ig-like domain-containing protein [Deltaproteobacteria bacterium]|nr:Ig-like domain-containing protein [Deltaproteobacteria bacterium]
MIICFFIAGACGGADRIDLSADGSSFDDGSGSLSGGEAVLEELSFRGSSTLVLTKGESKELRLSVMLSNAVTYSNITRLFDGPGDLADGTVAWFSNNGEVASVSEEGVITAVGPGATTIEATLGSKSAGINIVVKSTMVALSALKFHEQFVESSGWDSLSLKLDASFSDGSIYEDLLPSTLRGMVDCDLNFSSMKENVALISQTGEIWPVANGNAAMRLACGDLADAMTLRLSGLSEREEGADGEIIRSIDVTVDSSDWVVGDVRTLLCDIEFNTGTVSGVSTSFVSPAGSVGAVSWSSSDESILTISNGRADLAGYGEVVVTARFEDFADAVVVNVKIAPEEAVSTADRFLGDDDEYIISYGENGGYGSHLFPEIVHGMPQTGGTHVVSFGGGGYLLIILNNYIIVDGPGVDFTIFENAIQSELYGNFAERAQVYVSEDDYTYFPFDCDGYDPEEVYAGCAGVMPVNATENPLDPEVSGGDSFDLGDVGLSNAKYILIVDLDTCVTDDPTYYDLNGDLLCAVSGEQGFDLDAVAILNGLNE